MVAIRSERVETGCAKLVGAWLWPWAWLDLRSLTNGMMKRGEELSNPRVLIYCNLHERVPAALWGCGAGVLDRRDGETLQPRQGAVQCRQKQRGKVRCDWQIHRGQAPPSRSAGAGVEIGLAAREEMSAEGSHGGGAWGSCPRGNWGCFFLSWRRGSFLMPKGGVTSRVVAGRVLQ